MQFQPLDPLLHGELRLAIMSLQPLSLRPQGAGGVSCFLPYLFLFSRQRYEFSVEFPWAKAKKCAKKVKM